MKPLQHALGTVVTATLLVAACSSDGESKAAPVTTTTSAPASTSSAPAASSTTQAPPTVKALNLFQTPSQNIACMFMESETVECELAERSFSPPPKPSTCEFDWGQTLAVGPDGAQFTCVSDTFREGSIPVLGYGEMSRVGNVECTSKEEGLTCTHTPSRHGFFVSRARYELF